ncbi:MAG: orotidine-5'-phosphate decarboxylase [Betaproteobacteria bacterium]
MSHSKPVIVVLDYPDAASALQLVDRLDPGLCRVKVGKELFTAAGPALVEKLAGRGFDVFLDLKFHDIPNTVAGACRAAAKLGVWMLNVHASGGRRMLAAAREAIDSGSGPKPLLIGVTVLTSLSSADLAEIGVEPDARGQVLRLAHLCFDAGLDGVVCSAEEAPMLKAAFPSPPAFLKVTPGIRLAGDAKGDQQRVVTPVDAIRMGADYLVIGRSITHAADPVARLHEINNRLTALDMAPAQ